MVRSGGTDSGDTAQRPLVEITVPYAHERRNELLISQWRRQAGSLLPTPPLRLPPHGTGDYRLRLQRLSFHDVFIENQYSDALLGSTGTAHGHLADHVIAHFNFAGRMTYASERATVTTRPGELCTRRNGAAWKFEVGRGTHAVTLALPAGTIRFPSNGPILAGEQDTAAARLLLAHLRACTEVGEGAPLGNAARNAARNAAVELLQGMLDDQVIDDPHLFPTLAKAARDLVESRLTDPDLDPRAIADALHVSVRTLHRAFADQQTSIMEHVRQRRLERARADLLSTTWTVAEVAARWHFHDSSHFIRAHKRRYGETPTALRRRARASA
ncbi:helix-turn-helix transcriptional regulator [Actinospica sp. MGRD01-02]|uniref:Helix-turn-helix transcriptional regulator n=1 Tax=Actinospica acidithermotolerans TaxID=2828514 RepID=A0A941ILR9_9ACTN|nr:helix-turn-helix transcriptional regulator [Actinospica acidithermotolerans]MBR7829333.1 helix-turn-helix transcriptional regulator [Actinospica acidithermotolerans]